VGLIAPRPAPQHGLAAGQPQHGGHGLSQVAQVADQGVLGGELGRVPDGAVVTLHEDGQLAHSGERGRGHRPRAAPGHDRRVRGSVAPEDGGDLVVGKRWPVRCGELMAHAMDGVRALDGVRAVARGGAVGHGQTAGSARRLLISRAAPPASRVITAAATKDKMDADIQLSGVKPMSWPKDVHAEAHQDTYPGLMS